MIKKALQLDLTSREIKRMKKIVAITMFPIMVFYMTSMNILAMELMRTSAEGEIIPIATSTAGSEDKEKTPKKEEISEKQEKTTDQLPEIEIQKAEEKKEPVAITTTDKNNQKSEEVEKSGISGKNKFNKDENKEAKWVIDGKTATIGPIELEKTYKAPQNENVTVTFTKLPDNPGNLTIEEITLSDEQVEELSALSNKAYDITSDMKNGTFEYNLTLPEPKGGDNIKIKYAEKESELDKAKTIDDVDVKDGKVKAKELDHFTTFFIATYPDSNHTVGTEKTEYYRGETVYIKATGLDIEKYYKIALDPPQSGGVFYVSPSCFNPDSSNDSLIETYDLRSGDKEGNWKVKLKEFDSSDCLDSEDQQAQNSFKVSVVYSAPSKICCSESETSPYSVANPSIEGILNGHDKHEGDIIPSFEYDGGFFEGKNWDDRGKTIWNNNCVIPVDIEAPNVEITSPTATVAFGNVKIRGTVTDDNPHHYWLIVENSSGQTVAGPGQVNDVNSFTNELLLAWDTTKVPDGNYTIKLEARDAFGNKDSGSIDWNTVLVNNDAPSVPTGLKRLSKDGTKEYACGAVTTRQTLIPTWNANLEADIDHYEYTSFNAGGSIGINEQAIYDTKFEHSWVPTSDGAYGFAVRAVDTAGNKSGWALAGKTLAGSCQITYDSSIPTKPVITKPTNNQYFKTSPIKNEWTASTDASGIKEYWVEYIYDDGHTFAGGPYRVVTTTWRNHAPNLSEQGGVTIRVQAWDNAGNASEWSNPVHYYFDATAPDAPTLISPANNSVVKGISLTNSWSQVSGAVKYIYESYYDSNASNPPRYHAEYTTTSKTATGVADATFWWRVKAVDAAGNESVWSDLWKVTVDNTYPTIPSNLSFSTTGGKVLGCGINTNEYDIVANWGASFDVNLSHYEYRSYNPTDGWIWNGGNIGNVLSRTGSFTEGQGMYGFAVRAVDKAGNASDWTSENLAGSCQINYDSIAPEFTISGIKYPNGTIQDKYVTNWNTPVFVGNLVSSDTASVRVLVNGAEYPATINGTEWTAAISPALPDGSYEMQVVATDLAGNQTTITKTLIIDTKAPTATHGYYKDGNLITDSIAYVNNIGQLTFAGEYADPDPSSGLYWDSYVIFEAQDDHSFRFSANGKKSFCGWRTNPNLLDISGNSTFSQTEQVPFTNCIANLPDGEYYLAHHIYDSATRKDIPSINQFKDVLGLHFVVDSNLPESQITFPDGGEENIVYSNDWNGTVSGLAADDRSGVAGVELSIQKDGQYWNGSGWQAEEFRVNATGDVLWSFNFPLSELAEGTYAIKSHAVDNAGNVENTDTLTIVFDKTIPEVTLAIEPRNPNGDNDWYVSHPEISLSANDNFALEKIEYQIDSTSGTWNTYSAPIKIDDGRHVFYYRSIDKAGNMSGVGAKNVKVDTRNPDNVKNLDAEYEEDREAVRLTWDADDGDIDKVFIYRGKSREFHINGSSRIAKNDDNDESYTDGGRKRGEKYYYKFVTQDEAGNTSDVKVISVRIPEEGGEAEVTDEETEPLPQGTILGEQTGEKTPNEQNSEGNGAEEQVAGEETVEKNVACKNWPLWVWILALIIFALNFWRNARKNYREEKYRWTYPLIWTFMTVMFWYFFDKCREYRWFLYFSVISAIVSHLVYIALLKKKIKRSLPMGEKAGEE